MGPRCRFLWRVFYIDYNIESYTIPYSMNEEGARQLPQSTSLLLLLSSKYAQVATAAATAAAAAAEEASHKIDKS